MSLRERTRLSVDRMRQLPEQARWSLASMDAMLLLALLGLLSGLLAGGVILLFRLYTDAALLIWFGEQLRAQDFESLPAEWRLALPIIGGVSVGIVLHWLPRHVRAIGIGHVLERLATHQGKLPFKNALVQFFAGGLVLACGLPVGREGPAVHLGAAMSSLAARVMRLPNNSLRTMVGCGSAAAIAACFNTPLAGVIFALEVVMMEYSIASFVPIILAAVTSTVMARLAFGNHVAYEVPALDLVSLWEVPVIILLGLLAGLWASGFIASTTRLATRTRSWPFWTKPALAGVVIGVLALGVPEIMGTGYDTVSAAFHNDVPWTILMFALIGKTAATALCSGLGVPGGTIGPSLFIGATLGGLVGVAMENFWPGPQSGTGFYAMLGLAALMSATLQAPMSALIALLELTGNPNIIMPGMLTVVLANLVVSHGFKQRSIIHLLLNLRGVEVRVSPLTEALRRVGVANLIDTSFALINPQLSRSEAESVLAGEPRWLLVRDGAWPGVMMHATDLARALIEDKTLFGNNNETLKTDDIAGQQEALVAVPIHATLAEALDAMNEREVDAAYVYQRGADERIAGVLTRGKIESYYSYRESR